MYWCFPSDKLGRINRIPFYGTLIPGSCLPFFPLSGRRVFFFSIWYCLYATRSGWRTFGVLEKRRCIRAAFMEIFLSACFISTAISWMCGCRCCSSKCQVRVVPIFLFSLRKTWGCKENVTMWREILKNEEMHKSVKILARR